MKNEAAERYLLVLNAGSSSLRFAAHALAPGLPRRLGGKISELDGPEPSVQIGDTAVEPPGAVGSAGEAAAWLMRRLDEGIDGLRLTHLAATAHRFVHGGDAFSTPVRVTDSVLAELKALTSLAPLHNPASLAVLEAVAGFLPDAPMIAVFDTAFFRDLPQAARDYAVPAQWISRYAIRRYGFHGLAHQYIARQLERVVSDPGKLDRVISLQLGNGCSATALRAGRPVETSMGFTPLEGLVMGTRCGDLDPGVVLHMARTGLSLEEIDEALNRRSGLLGLSGESNDLRDLLALAAEQHTGAERALGAFYHRLRKYLGSYAAVLGGLDTLAFGGGIGENQPIVRAAVCTGLSWLGLELDRDANAACVGKGGRISSEASSIEVHVVPVDEQTTIAESVTAVLDDGL